MSDKSADNMERIDEQLVAYLDGELDPESAREIEARLASEPRVRLRLQSLERTWDMLDQLDAAPLAEPLAHTTLEMVAVAAREELENDRRMAPRLRRRRWVAALVCLLAALGAGFVAAAAFWPDPNRELLENLTVLEDLDQYRQIESIEFLRMLRDRELFPGNGVATAAAASADDSLEARRRRVERMDHAEKEQLRQAQERFDDLDLDERRRICELDRQLRDDPDAGRLRDVMRRYYEWLRTLPLYERLTELAEQPTAAERVEWIAKRLKAEQLREGGRRPGQEDMKVLTEWTRSCVERHKTQYLAALKEEERKRLADFSPEMQQNVLWGQMWQGWMRRSAAEPDKLPPPIDAEDLALLRSKLSPETRQRLEKLTPLEQWRAVLHWMPRWGRGGFGVGAGRDFRGPRPDDDERLAEFFERLDSLQRDRLLSMPADEMQRELHRLYMLQARPPEPPSRHPEGFSPGKRPQRQPSGKTPSKTPGPSPNKQNAGDVPKQQ
jgi:hypothetical protein